MGQIIVVFECFCSGSSKVDSCHCHRFSVVTLVRLALGNAVKPLNPSC